MSSIKCPKCGKQGYLVKEKKRKKRVSIRSFYRSNKKHKPYESAKRTPKPILRIAHNVKIKGEWKVKSCYLGVWQRVVYKFRKYRPEGQPWGESMGEVLKKIGMKYKLYSFDSKLPSNLKNQQEIATIMSL